MDTIALVALAVGNSRAVEVDNSADNSLDSLVDTGLDSRHSSALEELPSRRQNTSHVRFPQVHKFRIRLGKHALRNGILWETAESTKDVARLIEPWVEGQAFSNKIKRCL